MLKSEVEDLRILIQAADKDVESLKRLRNNDAIEGGRRYASLESKVRAFTFSDKIGNFKRVIHLQILAP